jgi:type IV pilus assembly protein PilN
MVLAGGVLLLILAFVLSIWAIKLGQIKSTQHDIDVANVRINELTAKIGKLEKLKKLKEQVYTKLSVLSELRTNKTGPAIRLAILSDITPDNLWLNSYKETGDEVKIDGLAFNEELIAEFIRALEASNEYQQVELVVSEQRDVSGTN